LLGFWVFKFIRF